MQGSLEIRVQGCRCGIACRRERPDHDPTSGRESVDVRVHQVPKPALHAIPHHRRPDRAAHDEPNLGLALARGVRKHVHDKMRPPGL